MKHVTIPAYWTGEEALTTVAFLEEIIRAIWRAHGDLMSEVLLRERTPETNSTPDEDHPF